MTGGRLLAIDTATSRVVVALGEADGTLVAEAAWEAGHRHGEELLPRARGMLERAGTGLDALGGIVVGTGPGAFTGLRVGLATAKALASALGLPIVGVSTAAALLAAAGPTAARLLLPAGPSDRILARVGEARLLASPDDDGAPPPADDPAADDLIAVDLAGRAPEAALGRGRDALERLPASLLRLGAARLASGVPDDLAQLVPEYVTLPRGVRGGAGAGAVAWSRAPR
jgi:tRNA threonylcarbamoyl adenosine modification protein YeaZ